MLRVYCDAGKSKTGVFSLAAVAFGIDRAKKAERDFAKLFGEDRQCHMTDLHNRKEQFEGIDDAEADRLCRGAINILNKRASFIAVVSCDVDEVSRLLPNQSAPDSAFMLDAVASAYNCCMHWGMCAMGGMLAAAGQQRAQYWFELGDEFQGHSRRFLSRLSRPEAEPLRRTYGYMSDAFVSATDARLFEAPDVVAWEWARHVDLLRQSKNPRKSLAALLGGTALIDGKPGFESGARYANHFEGRKMERFFGKYQQTINATSVEGIWDAARSREWD